MHNIQKTNYFIAWRDDFFNKETQNEKMDMIVQYFHVDMLVSQDYDSQSVRCTTAKVL